jgi:hypothetical protein
VARAELLTTVLVTYSKELQSAWRPDAKGAGWENWLNIGLRLFFILLFFR